MKRKVLIAVVIVIVAAALAASAYLLLRPTEKTTAPSTKPDTSSKHESSSSARKEPVTSQPQTQNAGIVTPIAQPGSYKDYSKATFDQTKTRRLLFFHASWCPQCRKLDEDIKKTALPSDLTIFKVNYDTENDLRIRYGVTLQTTVISVTADGQPINKLVAYDDPSYAALKKAFDL